MALVTHETYMVRCLELALKGAGNVAPNPMVGAVLLYDNRMIGEGYHMQYGQAHAEVNCIDAVSVADEMLIEQSTLYVSLEPCAHFGKTPPCADLIIAKKIPRVVIGCRDPFKQVNGRGIEKLKAAGVDVIFPVMEQACSELNKRFFTYQTKQRPYIILKWAQSANGFIGGTDAARVLISNEYSNRLVHRWRSEEAAILIGTNTALLDNPSLTTRLWPGKNPMRLVLDLQLRLPLSLHIFDRQVRTIIFNAHRHEEAAGLTYYQIDSQKDLIAELCTAMYQLGIQSVLVEGGQQLLQSFINAGMYNEARVITNTALQVAGGIYAPVLGLNEEHKRQLLDTDRIDIFSHPATGH